LAYILGMGNWQVEFTDEFGEWWDDLTEAEQIDVNAVVRLLEEKGPGLGRPHVGSIRGSRHANMKELVIQHAGDPYRVLFAFNPQRTALLLIGGNKTGNPRPGTRAVRRTRAEDAVRAAAR
jgi:hypothetical protein